MAEEISYIIGTCFREAFYLKQHPTDKVTILDSAVKMVFRRFITNNALKPNDVYAICELFTQNGDRHVVRYPLSVFEKYFMNSMVNGTYDGLLTSQKLTPRSRIFYLLPENSTGTNT